jgi:DNA-binding response OmpR family regulator
LPNRILVVDDSPTIRKVVAAILERHGFEAIAAADGQLALEAIEAADAKFDLVLLDFVMPRMNGFQFCRALRSKEAHRGMPVVLMSAKSDKIREVFVQQTGAIDAITKPFDAQALVAVIENAIRRAETWRARGEALAAGIPDEFEPVDSLRSPTASDAESRRARVAYDFVRKLSSAIAPALAKLPAASIGSETLIGTELASHLNPEQVRDLAEALRAFDFGSGAKLALSGDITIIPIGAVLQLLQIENQTGVLVVTHDKRDVSVAMRFGLIDMVQARGAGQEFRLGRYFVEHGLVTPEDIDALLRDQLHGVDRISGEHGTNGESKAGPPTLRQAVAPLEELAAPSSGPFTRREESTGMRNVRLLGDLLVDSGRVTREQLREALARQSSELIYEVLRWEKGRFEFRREPPPPLAESAQLGLPVASVVMEGFRRVDEWRVVEAGLGNFDAVLQPDPVAIEALGEERLARAERTVLDHVDGEHTVREIVAASHMSSFDVCKILFQLIEARLVRRRAA